MLMALFISIFNDVDYQALSPSSFTHDSYFTIEEGESPDYRETFGAHTAAGMQKSCVSQTFTLNGKAVIYGDNKTRQGGYWFVNGESKKHSELTETQFVFTSDSKIICPYNGTLHSSSKTSDGLSMEIDFNFNNNMYRMQIKNMERWWCCDGKVEHDGTDQLGKPVWIHTCAELKGTSLKQGVYLGRAIANTTTIDILDKSGNKVDLKTFFEQ